MNERETIVSELASRINGTERGALGIESRGSGETRDTVERVRGETRTTTKRKVECEEEGGHQRLRMTVAKHPRGAKGTSRNEL